MTVKSYRVMRYDDGRTFSTVERGRNTWDIVADAIAAEFEVATEDLYYEEEFDDNGEWTGYELACAYGQRLARVELP